MTGRSGFPLQEGDAPPLPAQRPVAGLPTLPYLPARPTHVPYADARTSAVAFAAWHGHLGGPSPGRTCRTTPFSKMANSPRRLVEALVIETELAGSDAAISKIAQKRSKPAMAQAFDGKKDLPGRRPSSARLRTFGPGRPHSSGQFGQSAVGRSKRPRVRMVFEARVNDTGPTARVEGGPTKKKNRSWPGCVAIVSTCK